jgi:hypothetical protein
VKFGVYCYSSYFEYDFVEPSVGRVGNFTFRMAFSTEFPLAVYMVCPVAFWSRSVTIIDSLMATACSEIIG